MKPFTDNIQIIAAPSILGLRPTGVECLAESLLNAGLSEYLGAVFPVITVPTLNTIYNHQIDRDTNCLNVKSIRDFSLSLGTVISETVERNRFPMVLGGDCSILLGIMPGLKAITEHGLIFLDAHADFYEPEKSITGEVADMDLAIITGRGPELITNLNNLKPYAKDENVVHIGQRDWDETKKYGSRDIRDTSIKCFGLADIEKKGMAYAVAEILEHINSLSVQRFWIHFDTDVLNDEINPAVDYRLPGGLQFKQAELLIRNLLSTGKMEGMSITIFNPKLDKDKRISKSIAESIGRAFDHATHP